jgi:hypothetical protein
MLLEIAFGRNLRIGLKFGIFSTTSPFGPFGMNTMLWCSTKLIGMLSKLNASFGTNACPLREDGMD